jgi:hypothetical protein
MGCDRMYLLHRFEQETVAADRASSKSARIAHLELALRYSILISSSPEACSGELLRAEPQREISPSRLILTERVG